MALQEPGAIRVEEKLYQNRYLVDAAGRIFPSRRTISRPRCCYR